MPPRPASAATRQVVGASSSCSRWTGYLLDGSSTTTQLSANLCGTSRAVDSSRIASPCAQSPCLQMAPCRWKKRWRRSRTFVTAGAWSHELLPRLGPRFDPDRRMAQRSETSCGPPAAQSKRRAQRGASTKTDAVPALWDAVPLGEGGVDALRGRDGWRCDGCGWSFDD